MYKEKRLTMLKQTNNQSNQTGGGKRQEGEKEGRLYLYNKNCPRIKSGNARAPVWKRACLACQHQLGCRRYAVSRRGGAWFGAGGPASLVDPPPFPRSPTLVVIGRNVAAPSLSSTDRVIHTTLFKPSSLCPGSKEGGLSHPANSRTSLVLGWDLNPDVFKVPTPSAARVSGKCSSALPSIWSPAGGRRQSFVFLADIYLLPTAFQEGDYFLPLRTACLNRLPSPGLAPFLPRCVNRAAHPSPGKAPQLEIVSFSILVPGFFLVQIQSYTSPAALSLPFVSPQEGIPSLHSSATGFLSPSLQSSIYGPPGCPSAWRHLCHFASWTLGVQSLLASTLLCLRDEGTSDPPTSPPRWKVARS